MSVQDYVATSTDGVPIHYDVQGNGTTALVFVHGWCGNRHVWDRQVGHFAPHYTVVSLDLAGHGASGTNRARWTMPAFGQDAVAVVEQLGLGQVVLIGHSMGGPVIVEAARRLPDAVIGLVGADTWHTIERTRTPEEIEETMAPFRADFAEAIRNLFRAIVSPTSDARLVEDIVTAGTATPAHIGIAAFEELLGNNPNLQQGLQEVQAPKITINATYPLETNIESAQRYGIKVVLMSGVGHLLMMEDPQTFNRLLDEAVRIFVHPSAPQ